MEGNGRCLIKDNIPTFAWRTGESPKNRSENSRSWDQDMNLEPPEYEAKLPIIRLRHSVAD